MLAQAAQHAASARKENTKLLLDRLLVSVVTRENICKMMPLLRQPNTTQPQTASAVLLERKPTIQARPNVSIAQKDKNRPATSRVAKLVPLESSPLLLVERADNAMLENLRTALEKMPAIPVPKESSVTLLVSLLVIPVRQGRLVQPLAALAAIFATKEHTRTSRMVQLNANLVNLAQPPLLRARPLSVLTVRQGSSNLTQE